VTDQLLARFGVCTDEVHADLETALKHAKAMGMREVEIQEFWGKPPLDTTDADLDRAKGLLDQYGFSASAIGSQFLKPVMLGNVKRGEVAKDAHFQKDLDILRAEIRIAHALGSKIVRTYGFRRDDMVGLGNPSPRLAKGGPLPDEMLEKIAEGLRIAAQMAADEGLVLGLENVRSCWANSGHNTGKILDATDHPALQAMWDAGNCFVSGGDPYPEGYDAVRGRICHVHVKDGRVVDHSTGLIEWKPVGEGEVDWAQQFAALRRDGYTGPLSLETHWHPKAPDGVPNKPEDSRISFEGIKKALTASVAAAR
jgi:sugar phosphate isomerase/epimerase